MASEYTETLRTVGGAIHAGLSHDGGPSLLMVQLPDDREDDPNLLVPGFSFIRQRGGLVVAEVEDQGIR